MFSGDILIFADLMYGGIALLCTHCNLDITVMISSSVLLAAISALCQRYYSMCEATM